MTNFEENNSLIIYKNNEGNIIVDAIFKDETLQRIRNIRSSERRFYQKITDVYVSCSIDYDKDSKITQEFFKTVQNKLHFAITGHTAAEIIYNRVDSNKEKMGFKAVFSNSSSGNVGSAKVIEKNGGIFLEEIDGSRYYKINI